jgi:hypothetical protein
MHTHGRVREAKSPPPPFHPPHFDGSVHIIAVWKKGESKIKKEKTKNLAQEITSI